MGDPVSGKPRSFLFVYIVAGALALLWLTALLFTLPAWLSLVFGLTTGLGLLALVLWLLVWMWRSHQELYRQFDLQAEGRSRGTAWFVLGIVFGVLGPLMLGYDWVFAANVRHVRRRLGLDGGIPPGLFVALRAVFSLGFFATFTWLEVLILQANPNAGSGVPLVFPASADLPILLSRIALGGGFLLSVAAWGWLQSSINAIWRLQAVKPGGFATGRPGAAGPVGQSFVVPEPLSRPPGSKRLKCPRCANLVWVAPNEKPYCNNCGFGTPPAPSPEEGIAGT